MKINKILLGVALLGVGLIACTSNDDDLKEGKGKGQLALSVLVDSRVNSVGAVSRAVTADDFPIEVVDKDGVVTNLGMYSEMKEAVTLSVGTYNVCAHSNLTLKAIMDEPYYEGTKEVIIKEGITTSTEVECKMKNTKIQVSYDNDFKETFKSWTIVITDGSNILPEYTENDMTPAPKYIMVSEKVSTITVSIDAMTYKDVRVKETRSIPKPEGSSSLYWEGNDALIISMKPGSEEAKPQGVAGIDIVVNAVFSDTEETVEIPVIGEIDDTPSTDGSDGTGNGGSTNNNKPTLTGDCLNAPVTYTYDANLDEEEQAAYPNVAIHIAGKELSNVAVKIDSDNVGFKSAVADYGLTDGEGAKLIGNKELSSLFPLPEEGEDTYDFVLTKDLFELLVNFAGTHVFTISVEDRNGSNSAVLTIKIVHKF